MGVFFSVAIFFYLALLPLVTIYVVGQKGISLKRTQSVKMSAKPIISFDISKNERFQITDNYKIIHRKLKMEWTIEQNEFELNKDKLQHIKIFVIAGPQENFTEEEFNILQSYLENGGSLWILLGDGGEQNFNTNVNYFLEQYGIYINSDTVVRPHYHKDFHPKECCIGGGIVCETMWRFLLQQNVEKLDFDFSDGKYKLHFHYPYGSTLNVTEPSNVLVTTGPVVYPFNRPLVAYYRNENNGKILAIGSGCMFHDKYITNDKTNDVLFDYFIQLLGTDSIQFNHLDFNDIELNDHKIFNDIGFVADMPKACLIDSIGSETPADFKQMFDMTLCRLSNHLLKDVISIYEQLHVKYEPLKIIKPDFEIPLPPLQLATFPPIFSEPAAPSLELYDLDDIFSSPRTQLAKLTGNCLQAIKVSKDTNKMLQEKELENYIKECARITGIINEQHDLSVVDILNIVAKQIVTYRPYE